MKRLRTWMSAAVICMVLLFPAGAAAEDEMEDLEKMSQFVVLLREFLVVMDHMYEIASNPERAAIFQLHEIEETYKESDNRLESVKVYRAVLEKETNPTIRTASHIMLGNVLKESGKRDEAIQVFREGLEESLKAAQ